MSKPLVTRERIADALGDAFKHSPVTAPELSAAAVRAGAHPAVLEALATLPRTRHFFQLRDLWLHLPDVPLDARDEQDRS